MTLTECLKTRGVIDYSLCHMCVKAVAYAMFFWLPFYLVTVHGVTPGKAAGLSIVYDLATFVGGPFCGFLVQKSGKPATIITIFVLLAAAPQWLINVSSSDKSGSIPPVVIFNIVASGFLVGGVMNILSAAVCAKIGGHGSTSRVTGVIDGIGSLGASATQIIIPLMGVGSGWGTVFGLLGALLVLSAFTIIRIVRDEHNNPQESYILQSDDLTNQQEP